MPSSQLLPYAWYDTPNIHLCTLRDFELLASEMGLSIADRLALGQDGRPLAGIAERRPNVFATGAIYLLRSQNQ